MAGRYYDPKLVIAAARHEIGYVEKKSNKDLDDPKANVGDKNFTKYGRDLDAIKWFNGSKNGVCGWCCVFVCWLFWKTYGTEEALRLLCQHMGAGNCAAGPYYAMVYFKSKKQLHSTPQPGDQIFFLPADGGSKPSHTGLVVDVDSKYVYTIEGNTSVNGVAGCVAEKKYALGNARIAGYGRPDWGEIPDDIPDQDTGDDETPAGSIPLYETPYDAEPFAEIAEVDCSRIVALSTFGFLGIEYDGGMAWVDREDVKLVAKGDEEVE